MSCAASPLAVMAAIENLKIIKRDKLVARAAELGRILCPELQRIQQKHPRVFGCFQGKGLVAGECLKVAPPLTISEAALRESLAVFEEAVDEVVSPLAF